MGVAVGQKLTRRQEERLHPCANDCGVMVLARTSHRRFCDACRAARRLATHARYRAKIKERGERPFLREQHGMTEADYQEMLDAQGGRCAGCHRTPPVAGKALHIDHDHTCCGQHRSCEQCRRGLLCAECNMALGLIRDNSETLSRLIGYVREGGIPSWLAKTK